MKITLNTSIPEPLRPQVEALVKDRVRHATIAWLPSRFPRYVMMIQPDTGGSSEPSGDSIFDSPTPGAESLSAITDTLETRIAACISATR